MNNKPAINWKRYVLEFLSIFIAVTSAFALSKWNENRNNDISQNKILSEIYYGLEKDMEDVRLNRKGNLAGLEAVEYFKNLLAGNDIVEDSIAQSYFVLTRDFISIQNTSGYETLKSKGLELIKNDSLRTKIISLYEYDYNTLKKLEEEYYELQFQANYFDKINNLIAQNLKFDANGEIIGFDLPLKLKEKDEKLFLTYLWKIKRNRDFILKYYTVVEENIIQLQKEIKMEIGR